MYPGGWFSLQGAVKSKRFYPVWEVYVKDLVYKALTAWYNMTKFTV
jgi:hypothetical protein